MGVRNNCGSSEFASHVQQVTREALFNSLGQSICVSLPKACIARIGTVFTGTYYMYVESGGLLACKNQKRSTLVNTAYIRMIRTYCCSCDTHILLYV